MVHDFKAFPELTNNQMQLYYFQSPHKQITQGFWADVINVHDGDTIRVNTNFRDFSFPIRMARIAAPELGESGADKAQEFLESRVLGQKVYVGIDFNNRVGKFGRIIGEINHAGLNLNDDLLRRGLVEVFF